MSYGRFAKTYDKLMDKSLYDEWAMYVQSVAKPNDCILELACGAGNLAERLCQTYQVIASDISEDMLVLAHEKVPHVTLLQMDMCEITLDYCVDMVICFADSICYLPDETSVKRAFSQAYQILSSGGYYLFDVHSIYQMDTVFADYQYQYCDDETIFLWQSYIGEWAHSVEHELVCCQQVSSGLYERYDDIHYQRTYPLEQYVEWLEEIGFSVEVTSDFGKFAVDETSTRWFFKAKKQ